MTTERPNATPETLGFLTGKSNTLTSAQIDPENSAIFKRYEQALALKSSGDLVGAAALLEQSCSPPSIYKGHYRELFKIWREMNRVDLTAKRHEVVIARVRRMIQMDQEMIKEMLHHWSTVQSRALPLQYFDSDRNILLTDLRVFLKAALAAKSGQAVTEANALLTAFFAGG